MGRADSLSRRVDWAEGVERDNENQIMLKKEWLEIRAMQQLVERPEREIIKRIKKARDKDEEVIKAVEKIKKVGVKVLRNDKWQIEKGLVLKEGKVYVPKDEKLRVEIKDSGRQWNWLLRIIGGQELQRKLSNIQRGVINVRG